VIDVVQMDCRQNVVFCPAVQLEFHDATPFFLLVPSSCINKVGCGALQRRFILGTITNGQVGMILRDQRNHSLIFRKVQRRKAVIGDRIDVCSMVQQPLDRAPVSESCGLMQWRA
jgi:hypothetical protein